MFSGAYNKALVAALMGVLTLIELKWGISIGWLTEDYIVALLAVASPILVWWTTNRG